MIFGTEVTLGLDLGATGVRAAEVSWQGGRPVLHRWAAMDFPTEVADWRNTNQQALSSTIRQILSQSGLHTRWAAHSVSGESVAPQYFNFPQLMPEDVAEAVRIEVETALPFSADGALISYVLFPEQRSAAGKARTHGLAIAADGSFVESRLAILRGARLESFAVETDATACSNAFLATHALPEGAGTTAVLNIGHRYSNLALLSGDGTLLIRDVPWGGSHLTKTLSEMLSSPLPDAEEMKRRHWEEGPSAAGALGERMDEALQSGMKEFVGRLRGTIEFWVSERLATSLGRMFVTGGGSQVRGLPEYLSNALAAPVERWSPLQENNAVGKSAGLKPWNYRMSVAFGLALRQFGK